MVAVALVVSVMICHCPGLNVPRRTQTKERRDVHKATPTSVMHLPVILYLVCYMHTLNDACIHYVGK